MDAVLKRLEEVKAQHSERTCSPFVCTTWAQTLDGYIANAPGVRTEISCAETFEMTHEIRAAFDSILVGIGTILADNPRLNARLSRPVTSPRPVVLDSELRTPLSAKFLHQKRGNCRPIIFCKQQIWMSSQRSEHLQGLLTLAIVRPIENPPSFKGHGLCFYTVLQALSQYQVASVMVEGGGKVLNSVISNFYSDFLVVTVAPRLFGRGVRALSVGPTVSLVDDVSLDDPCWQTIGSDVVLSGTPSIKRGDKPLLVLSEKLPERSS